METIRESILKQSEQYPGGIDAIHVQTAMKQKIEAGQDAGTRLPRLQNICEELEALRTEGLLERLDDAPGARLSSMKIYAKPGTYPPSSLTT